MRKYKEVNQRQTSKTESKCQCKTLYSTAAASDVLFHEMWFKKSNSHLSFFLTFTFYSFSVSHLAFFQIHNVTAW